MKFVLEGKEFFCVSALMANASPYFSKLLTGPWKESKRKDPIPIKGISVVAFESVVRFCYGLDPLVTGKNVVVVHKAADFFDLPLLVGHCEEFLAKAISVTNVLDAYSSMLDSAFPQELELRFWSIILEKPKELLASDSFLACDIKIIEKIVSCDWFAVPEEDLWSRCEALGKEKLAVLVPHFRYALMKDTFFVESVSKHLSREDSESVFIQKLLKKPNRFKNTARFPFNTQPIWRVDVASHNLPSAQGLARGDSNWSGASDLPQWFQIKFDHPVKVTGLKMVCDSFLLSNRTDKRE